MDKFGIKIKAVVKCGDKLLIVKKWYDDRIVEPYQWEFLDGELMFGEKPERAAERIVREQTQLEATAGKVLYTWSYVVGDTCYVGLCFVFECMPSDIFLSEELLEYAWVTMDEMKDYPMNESVLGDLKKAEEK